MFQEGDVHGLYVVHETLALLADPTDCFLGGTHEESEEREKRRDKEERKRKRG